MLLSVSEYVQRWMSTYFSGDLLKPVVPAWRCPLCKGSPSTHAFNCGWPGA